MYNTIRHKYATVNSIIYKTWDVAQWCKSVLSKQEGRPSAEGRPSRSRVRIFLKVFFY